MDAPFNLMMLVSSMFTLPIGIPMAVGLISRRIARWSLLASMAWGLGFASLLTLFVIPALYAIVGDLTSLLTRKLFRKGSDPEEGLTPQMK